MSGARAAEKVADVTELQRRTCQDASSVSRRVEHDVSICFCMFLYVSIGSSMLNSKKYFSFFSGCFMATFLVLRGDGAAIGELLPETNEEAETEKKRLRQKTDENR